MKEARKTPKPKAPRAPAQPPPPYRLDDALESVYAPTPLLNGLLSGGTIDSDKQPSPARGETDEGAEDEPPETVASRIARLPKRWMRLYAEALFEVGGNASLARRAIRPRAGGISHSTVEKYAKECPLLGDLIKEAQADGDGIVDAANYRSATVGDLTPVWQQGVLVGHVRRRDTRAAELHMRRRGMLAAEQTSVVHTGRVELVDESQMPEMLAKMAKLMFAPPRVIAGKVVSEADADGSK